MKILASAVRSTNGKTANGHMQVAESVFSSLAMQVRQGLNGHANESQSLGVIAGTEQAGATTVALRLARSFSTVFPQRVLLVDGDLAHASVSRLYGQDSAPGLWDALQGGSTATEHVQRQPDGTCFLAAGSPPLRNDFDFDRGAAASVMQQLKNEFHVVVVDLPPLLDTAGKGMAISSLLDNVVFVIEAERTLTRQAQQCVAQLRWAGANVQGLVFNKERRHLPKWLHNRI